jgi:hypothetical protein
MRSFSLLTRRVIPLVLLLTLTLSWGPAAPTAPPTLAPPTAAPAPAPPTAVATPTTAAPEVAPPAALETASTYLLTTDGIPFIENGQEVAITHTISLFEQDPIPWQQGNPALREHFKHILSICNANPALRQGDIVDLGTLVLGVAAFLRRTSEQQVLVVLSSAKANAHMSLDPAPAGHKGRDLATGQAVDLSAGLDMTPWSWRIIELQ